MRRRLDVPPCRRGGGFTLLEVLAALLVAAVAITFLLGNQLESIRLVGATRELRDATVLAKAKMQELAAGIETADAGEFEGREKWRWETRREQVPEALGLTKLTLTVMYYSAGAERTLELEQLVQ
jgi:prepilin-type N-terminal cleavage/methylation domain-containing protein